MKHITLVVGARPNFMKVAPLINIFEKNTQFNFKYSLLHTGQHYDDRMSNSFFRQLGIPEPDINLSAHGGSQAVQTGKIMVGFENYLNNNSTDLVIVFGDVNSTMACTIVAKKAGVKVAHVEAGIRSYDMSMPEEINRIVTDSISDYFFTTSRLATENLIRSGIESNNIHFVGNCMVDCLLANRGNFIKPDIWDEYNLKERKYILATLHRPSNVDEPKKLEKIIKAILDNSVDHLIVLPVHPRTKNVLNHIQLESDNLLIVEPLTYFEFNFLTERALMVITDSGGITEETTVLGVPCLTVRNNTERPETINSGTNKLIGTDPSKIGHHIIECINNRDKRSKAEIPELWDGKTSERIFEKIRKILNLQQYD